MTAAERRDIALAFATLAVIACVAVLGVMLQLVRGACHEAWAGVRRRFVTKGGST
jgi:hypothetical protein